MRKQSQSCSGTGAYTYNKNGDQITSTINGQVTTFVYDFDDQLVSITKPGTTTTYGYDALGRQVNRGVNGAVTGYYLDSNGSILEEKGAAGTVTYFWGNGLIRRGSEYPMTDGQGTTKLVTNSSQSVTSTQETEAFGRTIGTSGSTSSPFGYHGSEGYRSDGDGPAGLEPYQKVGARYYDATFGRFITRDTDLTQSPYAYCYGDPVNLSDPTGHSAKEIGYGFVAGVAGLVIGILLVAFFAPEAVAAVGVLAAIDAGAVALGFAGSTLIPGVIGSAAAAVESLLVEQDEAAERPEKTGGPCIGGGTLQSPTQKKKGLRPNRTQAKHRVPHRRHILKHSKLLSTME